MKRFIALVLSLVMTLSLCAPAWAAGDTMLGAGTETDPYIIEDAADLTAISDKYDTYAYYKVANGVETLDLTGVGRINLNGSFDGNGVTLNNLTTALFQTVGKVGVAQDIKISNLTANVNNTDGRALVRNIFNPGTTTFENVTMHGYIEGGYNIGSFYNYGTANADEIGADYTVSFVNAKSDVTLVCTTGNIIGGMLGHGYEGKDYQLYINMDADSKYTGTMYTTNGGENCYQVMGMCSHGTYILNGVETSRYTNTYPSTKLTIATPSAEADGYYVATATDVVDHYVVSVNAQVTAYGDNGKKIDNLAGMTWPLGNVTITDTDGKVFDLIESAEIVNGVEHDFGYAMNDGVLTIYSGRSDNYLSGWVTLQVNQYDKDSKLIATGNLRVYTFEDPTFSTVSFDANGGSGEMNALEKANGITFTLPECAFDAPAGKQFKGWATTADGDVITDTTYTVTKATTFYAIWEDITYSVVFDANGGSGEFTTEPMPAGTYTLPACTFTAPEGKQFKAWSVDGKEYAVGDKIDVTADVTVVAVWTYLPAVTEDPEVDVIDPVVSTGDKVNTNDATVNNVVEAITTGVEIDHSAITEAAEEAAEENKVVPTKEQAKELNKLSGISGTTVDDVAIVVQTYYDVAIEEVKVENNKTSSITVDITPMQQTVATTDDVIENKDDIKVGENAVKVGDPVPVKITEPVEITLKLPSSCFTVGQKVYITHKASAGTVIYEATVAADYTITFKTTHGFSPFTISTTAADVKASVGTDNYADLQSAVNYMGKNAVVTVKAPDQEAVVNFATTFTVKYENGATKDNTKITAAPGYYLTTKDVTGGVQYTVSRAYYGGYVGGTTATPDKVVTSADTFDAGIGLYVAMSVMAAAGSAVVLKKRED